MLARQRLTEAQLWQRLERKGFDGRCHSRGRRTLVNARFRGRPAVRATLRRGKRKAVGDVRPRSANSCAKASTRGGRVRGARTRARRTRRCAAASKLWRARRAVRRPGVARAIDRLRVGSTSAGAARLSRRDDLPRAARPCGRLCPVSWGGGRIGKVSVGSQISPGEMNSELSAC